MTGNLYMFGGYGYDTSTKRVYASNMWCFDISANSWTLANPTGVVTALVTGSYSSAP